MGIPSVEKTEPECRSEQESAILDLKKTDVSLIVKIKEAIQNIILGVKEKILKNISSFTRSDSDCVSYEDLIFENDDIGKVSTKEKFRRIRQKLLLQRKRKQRQSLTGGRLLAVLVFYSSFVTVIGKPISADYNTPEFEMKSINMEETRIGWTSSETDDMLTFTLCTDADYTSECQSFTAYLYESEFIINYRKLTLSPFTKYSVSAKLNAQVVFNSEFMTPSTGPEKPENFLCSREHGNIVFSWREPKVKNGPLSGYRISFQEQNGLPISALIKEQEMKVPEKYLKEPFTAKLLAYNERNGEQLLGSAVQISGCEAEVQPSEPKAFRRNTQNSNEDFKSVSGTAAQEGYSLGIVSGVVCASLVILTVASIYLYRRCNRRTSTPNEREKVPRKEEDCFTSCLNTTESYKKIEQTPKECV